MFLSRLPEFGALSLAGPLARQLPGPLPGRPERHAQRWRRCLLPQPSPSKLPKPAGLPHSLGFGAIARTCAAGAALPSAPASQVMRQEGQTMSHVARACTAYCETGWVLNKLLSLLCMQAPSPATPVAAPATKAVAAFPAPPVAAPAAKAITAATKPFPATAQPFPATALAFSSTSQPFSSTSKPLSPTP